jgi:hypothetical protein
MPFDLHLQMQEYYAGDSGACEVQIDSFRADVLRDGVIFEIQTGNLRGIRPKIARLLDDWPVVVVHPVALRTTIVYCDGDPPIEARRRKSPKRGNALDAFAEAVSVVGLLQHINFTLEVPLVEVEDMRRKHTEDEKERIRRRRKRRRNSIPEWTTINRRMTNLDSVVRLDSPDDGLQFIPESLPDEFTSAMFGEATGMSPYRARQVTYTLRHMGTLDVVGRTKRGYGYTRNEPRS